MDKKIIKKGIYTVLVLVVLGAIFVIADYFGLFGTRTRLKLDFVVANIRTIDAETGKLVFDVGVRCFQKRNNNACTRRDSHRAGIVSVHIPVRKVIRSTLLFDKSKEIIKSEDPKLHIMLIHQDYNNPTKTVMLDDIYQNKVNDYTVEMPPRKWEGMEDDIDEGEENE